MSELLKTAKKVIAENINIAGYGLFDTRNTVGDLMTNIYNDGILIIDVCYKYSYFEVFGLADEEFAELDKYYERLTRRRLR